MKFAMTTSGSLIQAPYCNRLFPDQKKMKTHKPLLLKVIDSIEAFIAAQGLSPVKFNIELNSVETEYGKYQS